MRNRTEGSIQEAKKRKRSDLSEHLLFVRRCHEGRSPSNPPPSASHKFFQTEIMTIENLLAQVESHAIRMQGVAEMLNVPQKKTQKYAKKN